MNLELARIPVQLDNRYPELETLCKGYETQKAPVICLSVTADEIETERRSQPGMFSDGYLETICLYRKHGFRLCSIDTHAYSNHDIETHEVRIDLFLE